MSNPLPQKIFVVREDEENDGGFLSANTDTTGVDNGVEVGIYELKEIKVKKVRHSLGSRQR